MAKELTASEKITLERMKLMTSHRFFASILLRLNIIEISEEDPRSNEIATLGVNAKGDLFYNTKFVNALSPAELQGVLCHEVLHVVLGHCYRCPDNCSSTIWNFAVDLVTNNILVNYEGIKLPEDIASLISDEDQDSINNKRKKCPEYGRPLIPRADGIYTLYVDSKPHDIVVKDRNAEAIYLELLKLLKSNAGEGNDAASGSGEQGDIEGKGHNRNSIGSCFDKHILSNGSSEEELSEEDKSELDRKWAGALASANMEESSNKRSDSGGWVNRQLSEFSRPQINWRVALHRYIREVLPYDCSYSRPSKRSYSTGVYTPIIYKKPENIIVAIDVSGSIGNKDLKKFISEIYGILKSYNNVGVRVLFWSTKVDTKNDTVYTITKINNILDVKPFTTGSTAISCVEKYLSSTISKESAIVYITDGYVESNPKFACQGKKRLFIISSDGSEEILSKYGTTARLKL